MISFGDGCRVMDLNLHLKNEKFLLNLDYAKLC